MTGSTVLELQNKHYPHGYRVAKESENVYRYMEHGYERAQKSLTFVKVCVIFGNLRGLKKPPQ
jgi:hypothetical protein